MLSFKYRLSRDEIEEVMSRGESRSGHYLNIRYIKANTTAKFTAVVSKKVSKGAIKRNKIKRNIREAARELIKEGDVPNIWIVVSARKESFNANFKDILSDLTAVLNGIRA